MSLNALIINCTLKKAPQTSNTEALINKAVELFKIENVQTEVVRLVDYNILPGTSSNEGAQDDYPTILQKIKNCDIFIVASPIWLGHTGSVAQRLIERMDSIFHEEAMWSPSNGQYFTYNKVAGALCTGNEDGAHEVTGYLLWAMQEFGFTVPPNVNAYWVGEAGTGPSYVEAGGDQSEYVNKTVRFMVYNLIYFAQLLKANPIPTDLKKLGEEAKKESK